MSEVLNAEVTSSEEGGLSRRRIVKGAAWSMPVIAAAIAAPAASASVTVASAALGAPVAVNIAGATAASGTGPTSFDIQTGSAFTGTSVSYTLTIESVTQSQKALIAISSVTPGTGTTSVPQNKKSTTFTSNLSTTAGNHTLHVALNGFSYTETASKGTFTYNVTLTVTVAGAPAIVKTSTFSVTFP
ncbi:hypothetical protein [Arthrobacter humicola]